MTDPPVRPVRLAVWSGPRNISTALMRSWENRPDTVVVDEPLYAAFLARTGIDHPGRAEVLAVGETTPRCRGALPCTTRSTCATTCPTGRCPTG